MDDTKRAIEIAFHQWSEDRGNLDIQDDIRAMTKALKVNRDKRLVLERVKNGLNGNIVSNVAVVPSIRAIEETRLELARYSFDEYMLQMETQREVEERFYLPRRKKLLGVVHDIQDLVEGDLDELFLSCPPRIGKTTLLLFFASWVMSIKPEESNLYCSYSDYVVGGFYTGISELITDDFTYRWSQIFPEVELWSTNADERTYSLGLAKAKKKKRRYASLTSRSLYGTLNGACDCSGFLIADDLISGIEEAKSKERLSQAYGRVQNNLITRCKESAKTLWIGTRWSLYDPIGRRITELQELPENKDRKYKVISTPALDENDESNFDYDYGVGFSSSFYKQKRAALEHEDDMASWCAVYQGEPIERQGVLFDDLREFNGVLPRKPDRIYCACDVAWGGGDYLAMPVLADVGEDCYMIDVVYTNEDKFKTRPLVAQTLQKHKVNAVCFEKNNGGDEYAEDIEEALRKDKYRCNIMIKPASSRSSKETRIFDKAPEIREIYFLEPKRRHAMYAKFMQDLQGYTVEGKNKHDDAPDSLAQAISMRVGRLGNYEIASRIF